MSNEQENKTKIRDDISAHIIRTMAPMMLLATVLALIGVLVYNPEQWTRFIPIGTAAIGILVVWLVSLRGHLRTAANMFIALGSVLMIIGMVLNGGVHAPVFAFVLIMVAVAAWLYNTRGAAIYALSCCLVTVIFAWLQNTGILQPMEPPSSTTLAFIMIGFILMMLIGAIIPNRMLQRALWESETRRKESEAARRLEQEASRALAQREKALIKSENRFRTLVENIPGVTFQCAFDDDWTMVYLSDEVFSLTGYPASDYVNNSARSFASIIHSDDRGKVQKAVAEAINSRQSFTLNYRIVNRSGEIRWVYEKGQGVFDGESNLLHLDGVILDVSIRYRAEAERERLLFALDKSDEIFLMTNHRGVIQYVNSAFTRVTGFSREETLGQTPRILNSGHHDAEFYADMWKTIKRGSPWHNRIINKKKDGSLYTEDTLISPVLNDEGEVIHYVAVKRDITKELQQEEQLRQAQKMQSIGQLAGGIAHDFNNILAGIIGFTEVSLMDAPKKSGLASNLRQVLAASERAKQLVRQILTFSRQGTDEKTALHLRPILSEVLALLKVSIPSSVKIAFELTRDTQSVLADPVQVHEVLMNLAVNGVHAMSEKGTLTLRSYETTLAEPLQGRIGVLQPERYSVIEVSDTGSGMDDVTLDRMFEPFYTTKAVGKGTGMGLSVVYGVMQGHKGEILVKSEKDKGTTVQLYFPPHDEKPNEEQDTNFSNAPGNERILFVDDEEAIVEMIKQMLGSLGYKVTTTTDSQHALRLLKQNSNQYDMLITDQTMPSMTGIELAEEVMRLKPSMPVILCTGYSASVGEETARSIGIRKFCLKPLRKKELNMAIREVFDDVQNTDLN